MTPQEYIQNRLDYTGISSKEVLQREGESVEDSMFRFLLSKKFRKYSATPELVEHIKASISLNVKDNKPINITFVNGAYKLWRLKESPNTDWAELFSILYFTNWIKPICEVYKPGVWFDFFMDDLIVPKMNNIESSDVDAYVATFEELLAFMKKYQPDNLNMTLTRVGDQFESPEAFDISLEHNIGKVTKETPGGLPEIGATEKASIDFNVKTTEKQLKDPKWREKVSLLHTAYTLTKREPGYHYRPEKIIAFTQPFSSGAALAVGTTKTSVMKFWVGVGALKRRKEEYIETILSQKQLEKLQVQTEKVNIAGLNGENFKTIRVVS